MDKKETFVDIINYRSSGLCRKRKFQNTINGSRSLISRLTLTDELHFHDGCVNSLNFNSKGNFLLSGSDDLKIALWDWSRDATKPLATYASGHSSNVFQTKFMENSNDTTIVSCARDGQVRVSYLDCLNRMEHTKRVAQHHGSCHKLCVHPGSSSLLLSAGEDAVVFNIDIRQPKPNKLFTLKNSVNRKVALYSIDVNPLNTNEFAVCGRCEWARIFDLRKVDVDNEDNGIVKKFCAEGLKENSLGFKPNITCLMYNFNGKELLCSYNDEDIYLFDTSQSSECKEVHKYTGHRNSDTVKGVNFFGPHSEYIISGSDCSNIFIWDKSTEDVVTFLPGDQTGVVNVLEPHPTCCILATAGLDHQVKLWQPTGEKFDNFQTLEKQMKKNASQRDEDLRAPDMLDNQTIYLMIRQLQRQNRRLNGQTGGDDDSDNDDESLLSVSSDDDSSDDDDDISYDGSARARACIQS